jgi:hypothetical protein
MDKAQLFAALEAEVKAVEVKAVNAVLYFKVLTGKARDEFQALITSGDKSASHFEAAIVAATVVDANGVPTFNADDVATLRDKSASAVSAIAAEALKVNNIGADAEEAAVKN